LKLAAAAADLDAARGVLAAIAPCSVPVRRTLVSTYFDTPDFALRQAGSTLRVRDDGASFVQSLKTVDPGGTDLLARGEWEDPVAENRPDPQATHSGARLPEGVGGALHPLFVTEVTRETVEIKPAPGTLIEAAVDTGQIRAIVSGRTEPISEIELELKSGDPAALYDLALRLLETVPLRIETRSKSERGYRLVAASGEAPPAVQAEPVAFDPRMVVEEAVRSIGRSCLTHMLRNEPAALAGRAEGVHQMRVAVRRLRSLLSALKRLLPDDERSAVGKAMSQLAAPLGPARNLDVFATELLAPLRVEHPAEPGWDVLAKETERARADAHDRVDQEILSPRHAAAVLQLLRWFESRGWRQPCAPERAEGLTAPIGTTAPGILDRRRRAVRKRSRGFDSLPSSERHRLRIAVKKLRYTVELLGGAYDQRDLRRYNRRLKRVQEDLGRANDLRVAYGLVIELSRRTEACEPIVDAGAELLAWHERELARGERKLHRRLQRLNRAEPFWRDEGRDAG
jgi:triphosphatase